MKGADRRRLEHILDQLQRIERYTAEGRTAFDRDQRTQDAVLHCLTVIGEAAGALTQAVYEGLSSLPPKLPRGQRNIIVHEYWRIDPDIVWATVTHDLAQLETEVARLLSIPD